MNRELDLNPLVRLKEALEGAQKNTTRMLAKLEKFDSRLTDLDSKIRPLQNATAKYTRARENISMTLIEVGKTYEYFRIANEVRDIINDGLNENNKKDFFDALGNLCSAKQFFESHDEIKSSNSVLGNIRDLLEQAIALCVEKFESHLNSFGRSVEFVNGEWAILRPMSQTVHEDIKAICECLETNKLTPHFEVFRNVRIARLKGELKELELSNSAWATILQDGPYKKGSHPFHDYYGLAYSLLRSELQLWGLTLPSNEDSLEIFVSICDALIGEVNKIMNPLLYDDQSRQLNPIIRQSKLLLVRMDVLEILLSRYEDFRDLCRPDVRNESAASLNLANLKLNLVRATVESVEYLLSNSFAGGFVITQNTNARDAVSETMACDLHPVTGSVLHCCKELTQYETIYKRIYDLTLEVGLAIQTAAPSESEDFLNLLLEQLWSGLEERAASFDDLGSLNNNNSLHGWTFKRLMSTQTHHLFQYEDKSGEQQILKARKNLFLANNLYSILNYAKSRKAELSSNQNQTSAAIKRRMEKAVQFLNQIEKRLTEEKENFCSTIAAALGMLPEELLEFKSAHERDRSGKGRVLKAKFAIFNTGMDALLAQQGEWRVSSVGLRDQLGKQLLNKVLQPYIEFFGAYSTITFSKKHMDKYLKYTPDFVESNLKSFFGRG